MLVLLPFATLQQRFQEDKPQEESGRVPSCVYLFWFVWAPTRALGAALWNMLECNIVPVLVVGVK